MGRCHLASSRPFRLRWVAYAPTTLSATTCWLSFSPAVQATIVNFAVKEKGLEAQLLGTVVKMEVRLALRASRHAS